MNLLAHLGLAPAAPTREYLDQLVAAHQGRIPFETLTKILDHGSEEAYGGPLPPVDVHVRRMCERGAGGTCWTLARSFRHLLVSLGFDAHLVYMEPGHVCLRVELDGVPYYADVGYCAPLFRAYPLWEPFRVEARSEVFEYVPDGDQVTVLRTPGGTKSLSPTPRDLSELSGPIEAANRWETSGFLKVLIVARWFDGHLVKLREGELQDWREPVVRRETLDDAGITRTLERDLEIDPALYFDARAARDRLASVVR